MAKKPLNVLVLEDCEDDALLLVRELGKQGFDIEWERAWTAPAMKSLLEAKTWDVLLSDYSMLGFDAPAALELLKQTRLDLPFIVISGAIGEETAVAAMKHGAHDYLMKGKLARLGSAIERELKDAEVRREHQRSVDKIENLNRLLRSIRSVNRLITTEKDRDRLLTRAAQILVETRGYASTLCFGIGDDQRWSVVAHSDATEIDKGPSGEVILTNGLKECMKLALATNEVVVLESDAPECIGCSLAPRYPNRRLARGLVHDGKAHGVLVVALPEDVSLEQEELDLFEEVTEDLASALHGIEMSHLHEADLERFRIITESSPDAIFVADQTGKYTYVNRAASELLGYSSDELTRMTVADFSEAGQKEKSRQIFQQILAKGHVFTELDLVRKDGSVVPVELNAVTMPNGEVYGSCRDLSERQRVEEERAAQLAELRRAQEALRRSEARYRRLFEAANDGILILDADTGKIVDVNPSMTALTGYSYEDFEGKHLWEVGFLEDVVASKAAFAELREKRYVRYDDLSLECSDGRKISVELISTTHEFDQQNIVQWNIRDISVVKQMRAQVGQADRLATMGMLAAGVAHEINNPLAFILYNLESLTDDLPKLYSALRKSLDTVVERIGNEEWAQLMGEGQELLNPAMLDDIRARLADALQGTHRIREVARGLGAFARVDKEGMVPVALKDVIEAAIAMAFNEIKYRARLVKEYGTTSTILANDGRLSQVFVNLLVNAAHAIVEGDVEHNEIRVRTWQEDDEVLAEVCDTGTGIPQELLSHLFEPFFTTKEIGVGTGLGLSISKTILEECGGRIEVESEVGKGTRFVVHLPVRKAAKEDEAAQDDQAALSSGVRGRILVVDDEATIRAVIVGMLRGHDVVQAVSGEEARKILEADQAFELILCDMMMPGMSGVGLHEWLLATHPDLAERVVFVTGGAFTPKAQEHLNKVSNTRIEKPFDIANFRKIVAKLIRAYRNRGSEVAE